MIASAEELYINGKTGNDKNSGPQLQPFKTIGEAAKRINAGISQGAATNYLFAEGTGMSNDIKISIVL